jgi:hypothetical protein
MDVPTKVARLQFAGTNGELNSPIPEFSSKTINGVEYLAIDKQIALPVYVTSAEFNTSSDISILDINGREIGLLSFTSAINSFSFNTLTSAQLVAYFTDIDLDTQAIGADYVFTCNYLILKSLKVASYIKKYLNTAPLWGRFSHSQPSPVFTASPTAIQIQAANYSVLSRASKLLNQAALQPFPAERFLKLYHVLENDFDKPGVLQLQSLDIDNDYFDIGRIFKDVNRAELPKLTSLVKDAITDFTTLERHFNLVLPFQAKAEMIFHTFGKETNPLNTAAEFQQICSRGGFNHDNVKSLGPKYNSLSAYHDFLLRLCAYWIYRIRCCVAHNKVGEYSLQPADDNFVIEFAEPMIRAVLTQYLK